MPRKPRTKLVQGTVEIPGVSMQFIGAKTRGLFGAPESRQLLGYKRPGDKRFRITSGAVKIRRK